MSSTSVNRPVDLKQKEAYLNKNLQVYGIYSALAKGKAPSNKQLDTIFNSVLHSKALSAPSSRLSNDGKTLISDVCRVLEQLKLFILVKNGGNLFQNFIWQTRQVKFSDTHAPQVGISKDVAKQNGHELLDGLRTLGTLLITNGQFRKLLNDFVILFRSMAGDAASIAATHVNPTPEQLTQIDEPAEDNTWHEAPNLSADRLKDDLKSRYEKNKPFGNRNPAKSGTTSKSPLVENSVHGPSSPKTEGAMSKWQEKTKEYMSEKIPRERRDQTIWRLKKMIAEIQGHQDYQRAVETILRLFEEYSSHLSKTEKQGADSAKELFGKTRGPLQNLKTIIERIANFTSLDDLNDSVDAIFKCAKSDSELKGWFSNIGTYIRNCLKEQGYVLRDSAEAEGKQLYNTGTYLIRDKYSSQFNRVFDESKAFGKQLEADPQNQALEKAIKKLCLDLGQDGNGKLKFKPHLVKDLSDVVVPGLLENVHYIPVPRVEYSDQMFDMVVENLVIEADNMTPNVMELSSDNFWRWGRRNMTSRNKNKAMLYVAGIQTDMRDVNYYIRRKEGFPSFYDVGVVDVLLGGEGLSFRMDMETADPSDTANYFKVNDVKVDIKNLQVRFKQSRHKFLIALVKPIVMRLLRPIVSKVVEKQLRESAAQFDSLLCQVKQEVDRQNGASDGKDDSTENIYKRYASTFKKQLELRKQQKGASGKQKPPPKINFAFSAEDSIFPDLKLPSGISNKATEYRELAARGDQWESPVFSLCSSQETIGIPSPPAITRKSKYRGVSVSAATLNANVGAPTLSSGPVATAASVANEAVKKSSSVDVSTKGFSREVEKAFDGQT